jgi:hypothetical protein
MVAPRRKGARVLSHKEEAEPLLFEYQGLLALSVAVARRQTSERLGTRMRRVVPASTGRLRSVLSRLPIAMAMVGSVLILV